MLDESETFKEPTMGIINFVEEAAGAFAGDKALEAVDPNAGFLTKVAAAVAGFEGVAMLKEHLGESANESASPAQESSEGAENGEDGHVAQA